MKGRQCLVSKTLNPPLDSGLMPSPTDPNCRVLGNFPPTYNILILQLGSKQCRSCTEV